MKSDLSLIDAMRTFGNETDAESWFIDRRWPNGMRCAYCESDRVSARSNGRKTPAYRCNTCKRDFTVKTGTIMHDSKLPLSKWGMAIYLITTSPKGISSVQLARYLGITQKSAWHLGHRIRETYSEQLPKFTGPVEVDETFVGGLEKNKHADKKHHAGTGSVGKTIVAGIKDWRTGKIESAIVPNTQRATMLEFIQARVAPDTIVITDEASCYRGLPFPHVAVAHARGQYVADDGISTTNGIESHWGILKRAYKGIHHFMTPKHLPRYVIENDGRHNLRPLSISERMATLARNGVGRRLTYATLVRG